MSKNKKAPERIYVEFVNKGTDDAFENVSENPEDLYDRDDPRKSVTVYEYILSEALEIRAEVKAQVKASKPSLLKARPKKP